MGNENSMRPGVCPHDCPSVCALDIEVTVDGRMGKVRGSKRNPYTAGVVCAKVGRYAERYHHPDRLATPLRRRGERGDGDFEPVSWEAALDAVAEGLTRAVQRHGSETVWPYYYAGTMGHVQRDGINRLRHVMRYSRQKSTICTMLTDTGWRAGYGRRWGVSAEEAGDASDLIVVWGCNPVHTHVNLMSHIARARKERGAKLVVIDPYRTGTAAQADMHLALRPGSDGALACAVMHVLFKEGFADRDFIARMSDAPADLESHLAVRDPAWAAAITGLAEEEIVAFARLYGSTRRSWLRLGYGFTRTRNGAASMHAASCLPVVTGAWAHEGGGALFSNSDAYDLDKTLIEGLDVADPSIRMLDQSRIGPILTGEGPDLGDGPPVTALFIQNTNPMCVAPDLGRVHRGFARPDLFTVVHEQFMTDTARMADIVLPATMFVEHDDIYTAGGHSRLQISRAIFEPFAEARSNHWVLGQLAKRLGAEHPGFAMTEWELIDDMLAKSGWPDAKTIYEAGGHDIMPDWNKAHHVDGFPTPDGRFRFRADWKGQGPDHARMPVLPDHLAINDAPTEERPFRLVAAPARQFLNSTFTETPSSRRREGEPRILVHPAAMDALGIAEGDLVEISNEQGAITLPAAPADRQQKDTVVVESIWPNGAFAGAVGINLLTSAEAAPPNGGAVFHDTAVALKRAASGAQ